jgi:hypothetical protein
MAFELMEMNIYERIKGALTIFPVLHHALITYSGTSSRLSLTTIGKQGVATISQKS